MRGPILFIDLIPELRDLPEDIGTKLARKYYYKCILRWEWWLGYVGLAGCICLWDELVNYFTNFLNGEWVSVFEVLSLIVFGALGALIHNLLVVHAINRELRKQKQ